MVVQRYDELFSQARLEALDAIEEHLKTCDADEAFGIRLVLDVFKVSKGHIYLYVGHTCSMMH